VSVPAPDIPDNLALERTQIGRRMVLGVEGEIDILTAPEFARSAEQALTDGALELWIDLSQVTFIDSTGIHLLLHVRDRVRELQRRLAVICPIGPIRRALTLTGLDEALPLYVSREEAHRHG